MATFVWLHVLGDEKGPVKRLVNMDHAVKTQPMKGDPGYTKISLRDGPSLDVTENEATIAELLAAYGVSPPERSA